MAILQPLINIAEICAQKGVHEVILSPGSRCAHLTIAFVRHLQITTRSISDERSAAFIALGIAQKTGETAGLVCTSGTAVLNYAPAITEAFFQQIPILIFTADRPAEWIAQQDGQTIYQRDVYGRHIKASYDLPSDYTHPDAIWHINRIVNEAINLSQTEPKGPVHINVPIREPFYPTGGEKIVFDRQIRITNRLKQHQTLSPEQWVELKEVWEASDRKLIIAGQHKLDLELVKVLQSVEEELLVPIVGDIISNMHPIPVGIRHQDIFLARKDEKMLEQLRPDLLITFGQSVISKNLKLFLRQYPPYQHWHIQPAGTVADPFQSLTSILPTEPLYFFRELFNQNIHQNDDGDVNTNYYTLWQEENRKAGKFIFHFLNSQPFSEFVAIDTVLDALPENSVLHLANSMAVRYANFLSINPQKNVAIFANRGTSGIDGSTSTAVGSALTTNDIVTLITGDVAFFYDRNALWNNYLPDNLRIILLNNHGGGIFRILDGPNRQPELDEFFATKQPLNARNTAQDAGMEYYHCNDALSLKAGLATFFTRDGKAKILEIETDSTSNTAVFAEYKKCLQHNWQSE